MNSARQKKGLREGIDTYLHQNTINTSICAHCAHVCVDSAGCQGISNKAALAVM